MVKKATQSKTIRVGAMVTLASIVAVIVEVWALLDKEQMEMIETLFGPELFGVLGLIMVFLRVITYTPIKWRDDE